MATMGCMDTLTSTNVVDRPDLATVALAGNDVLRYLHAVCTQHTLDLVPAKCHPGAAAVAQGQDRVRLRAGRAGGGALLDTEAAAAPALAQRLARFRVPLRRVGEQPSPGGPACSARDRGPPSLAAAGLPTPPRAGRGGQARSWSLRRSPVGVDLLGPGAAAAATALERVGVERGGRAGGLAGSPRACPGQAPADRRRPGRGGGSSARTSTSTRGCYPGQETVARVHNLGQVQRRLAGLRFEPAGGDRERGRPVPAPGPTWSPTTAAAPASSAAWSTTPAWARSAFAYVRRAVEDGRLVRAGDRWPPWWRCPSGNPRRNHCRSMRPQATGDG